MTSRSGAASSIVPREPARRDPDGITIRPVSSEAEYDDCVTMQHEIWGESYSGTVPTVILSLAQRLGGVVAGAFDADDRLLGFVFGMTGLIEGRLAHWSDLLAVRPAARDRGIGQRLKRFQRDALRGIGVDTIYWTYDPLVARNAHLNLVKLGAIAAEYVIDFYGADTGSTLHGALGTDRFIVQWDIVAEDEARAARAAAAIASVDDGPPIVNPQRDDAPPILRDLPSAPRVRIEIPPDIYDLIDNSPDIAQGWRATTREAFTWYLGRGYRVTGFSTAPGSGRCFYTVTASET